MKIEATQRILSVLKCVVLCSLWTESISAGGSMQITLISYIFSYESGGTTVKSSAESNVMIDADYVKNYKPQWTLRGVTEVGNNPGEGTSRIPLNNSVDVWPWVGVPECSHSTQYTFIICLDYERSYDLHRPCTLQRIQTAPIPIDHSSIPPSTMGGESVTFGSYLPGAGHSQDIITNPLRLEFPDWKDSVRISVYVKCCGESPLYTRQCNEIMFGIVELWPRPFLGGIWTVRLRLRGRGSLLLSVNANCDRNYFPPGCDLFCRVSNPAAEHAFCNSSSGLKHCLAGWSGPDCQTDVDECSSSSLCQNGGTCENRPGSFYCSCMLGTHGRFCEQRSSVCHLKPCHNMGTCLDSWNGSACLCAPGFSGQLCQRELNDGLRIFRVRDTTLSAKRGNNLTFTTSASIFVSAELSRASINKSEVKWHYWYLAVILGGFFLLVLTITVAILHRRKIRNGYKVIMFFMSSGVSNTSRSEQQSEGFNNDVYQISNITDIFEANPLHGLNSDNKINSVDYSHINSDHEINAEESNLSGKFAPSNKSSGSIITTVPPGQGREPLQYDSYDYLHEHISLKPFNESNMQSSLLVTKQLPNNENKPNNMNSEIFNREERKVQNIIANNADLMWTKSWNKRLKGTFACSSFLELSESFHGDDISITHFDQNISNPDFHNVSDEHIYEEIDAERISTCDKSKRKESLDSSRKSGNSFRASEGIVDDFTTSRYPDVEDEHGYLRPRGLVALCEDFSGCIDKNECITLSNFYDCPRNSDDDDTRATENNAFGALNFPYTESNNIILSQSKQFFNNYSLDCQSNSLFPICPESQNYPAIYESVD